MDDDSLEDIQDALEDLIEKGLVESKIINGERVYRLSSHGKMVQQSLIQSEVNKSN
jgi:predicted transcriptional regulator with HTH domain